MTEWLLALVPTYGLWLLAAGTFLSCLALPIPASILMLTAGGFVAAGDLALLPSLAAAATGGIAGDQLGFWIGRRFGAPLLARMQRNPARAHLLARAVEVLEKRGLQRVFLSRWLFSPLGPWVNLTAGSAGYDWRRFSLAGGTGEAVWAGLYIGFGYGFAGNIEAATEMLGSVLGLLAAGTVMIGLAIWLRHLHHSHRP